MSAIEHVVIAAAGLGSRLGHGLPKCLVELDGTTLIERQLALFAHIPDIRIVVGYMEQAVMDAVNRLSRNVVFVRNPDFRTTTTQDSYALGASGLSGQCVYLDADIVFDPRTLRAFLDEALDVGVTIGITAAKTDDAVFVDADGEQGHLMRVSGFSRERASGYEWANIVVAPADTFHQGRGAVFESLAECLPIAAKIITSYEIDTEQDLERALAYVRFLS